MTRHEGDLGPKFRNIVIFRFPFSSLSIPAIHHAAVTAGKSGGGSRAIRENVDVRRLSGAAVEKLTDTGSFRVRG